MAAHEARADFLAGELVEKLLLVGDREMAIARAGRCHFDLRIDGVLGGIDADRPNVRPRKFPALADAPRPNRARASPAWARFGHSLEGPERASFDKVTILFLLKLSGAPGGI